MSGFFRLKRRLTQCLVVFIDLCLDDVRTRDVAMSWWSASRMQLNVAMIPRVVQPCTRRSLHWSYLAASKCCPCSGARAIRLSSLLVRRLGPANQDVARAEEHCLYIYNGCNGIRHPVASTAIGTSLPLHVPCAAFIHHVEEEEERFIRHA